MVFAKGFVSTMYHVALSHFHHQHTTHFSLLQDSDCGSDVWNKNDNENLKLGTQDDVSSTGAACGSPSIEGSPSVRAERKHAQDALVLFDPEDMGTQKV